MPFFYIKFFNFWHMTCLVPNLILILFQSHALESQRKLSLFYLKDKKRYPVCQIYKGKCVCEEAYTVNQFERLTFYGMSMRTFSKNLSLQSIWGTIWNAILNKKPSSRLLITINREKILMCFFIVLWDQYWTINEERRLNRNQHIW